MALASTKDDKEGEVVGVADITIEADDLFELVALRTISCKLIRRIHKNYAGIVGINAGLIILGIDGVIQPTTSAMLHNMLTIVQLV